MPICNALYCLYVYHFCRAIGLTNAAQQTFQIASETQPPIKCCMVWSTSEHNIEQFTYIMCV